MLSTQTSERQTTMHLWRAMLMSIPQRQKNPSHHSWLGPDQNTSNIFFIKPDPFFFSFLFQGFWRRKPGTVSWSVQPTRCNRCTQTVFACSCSDSICKCCRSVHNCLITGFAANTPSCPCKFEQAKHFLFCSEEDGVHWRKLSLSGKGVDGEESRYTADNCVLQEAGRLWIAIWVSWLWVGRWAVLASWCVSCAQASFVSYVSQASCPAWQGSCSGAAAESRLGLPSSHMYGGSWNGSGLSWYQIGDPLWCAINDGKLLSREWTLSTRWQALFCHFDVQWPWHSAVASANGWCNYEHVQPDQQLPSEDHFGLFWMSSWAR